MKPRDFQARLLADPAIVDAVPEGALVRLVSQARPNGSGAGILGGVATQPTPGRFEDGFMVLLQQTVGAKPAAAESLQPEEPLGGSRNESVVEVHDLDRRFGTFVAVDRVSFNVKRGEISVCSGRTAGKTTTFRMLAAFCPLREAR